MPTIRKRQNGRWEWRVKVRGRVRSSGHCPTKKCANECARKAEEEIRQGGDPQAEITVAEAIDRYTAQYLPKIPDSAQLYGRHLRWWREELGQQLLEAITPQMLSARKLKLQGTTSRFGRPMTPATVNRYFITLSSFFSWALRPEIGLTKRNPVSDVERLKEPPKRVRWLTRPIDEPESELERLFDACSKSTSPHLFDVVALLLTTGCRENEIMGLRRQDIRLAEEGFVIPAERAKTERPRFVPLAGLGLDVVRRRLEVPRIDSQFLFPGRQGKGAWFPRKAWLTALREAGIEDLRPHDLRHTFGSYLAMLGKSLPEIMEALGHRTAEAAMRYVHLADGHKSRVSVEVNEQITAWSHEVTSRGQS
jgi:integrase